jgi:CubicO group peptidase (beta-lactamase class C family)
MKRLLVLCAVIVAATIAVASEPAVRRWDGSTIAPAQIDETVNRLMRAAEVTGVGIAIINDGKVVYLKSYGVRDKEKGLPLTPDTVMSAASFTKVTFAYMVMRLVDTGALDLDRPVYQYLPRPLPEYPNYKDLADDSRYRRITVRMLLDHTSGFANWRAFEDDRRLHIHFDPGSRFAYSGEGIVLLQLVVEAITHKPLEQLMQEHVFQRLGMTRTSMVWQSRFESDFAGGYDEYGRPLGPQRREYADAAGSMQTTPRDFARFVQAVMPGEGLKKSTQDQMLGPQIRIHSQREFPSLSEETTTENDAIQLSYGLGWGLYTTPYGMAFFKEGHDEGWRNYAVGLREKKSAIVIMTNSGNGEGIYKELLESLLKNTYTPIAWEGFTPYKELPPRPPLKQHKQVHVEEAILEKYAGRYGDPPNIILTVRREGDHLSIQENDEPKQDLMPESDKDFFSTASDDEVTFKLDAQGHTKQLILHLGGGRDIPVKRIE